MRDVLGKMQKIHQNAGFLCDIPFLQELIIDKVMSSVIMDTALYKSIHNFILTW